uniref:thioredoxin-dependent peroxiredoxin n=1 Tax=Acrobeloides nanus TaxID=290746 RepID=A0A914EFH7_9BILA
MVKNRKDGQVSSYVCPTELIAFSDRIDEFKKIHAEVVTISTNSKFSLLTATQVPRNERGFGMMKIPLISDENHKISRDYGILDEEKGVSYRGFFVIDEKGIIRQITINDKQVGRSVDEALRLVQAYQFSDKNEQYCPVDWHPGDECMKPTLQDSLKYYQKHY